jgi:hypothetical protein
MENPTTTNIVIEDKPAPYSWVKDAYNRAHDTYRKSHLHEFAEKQRKYYAKRKDDESFKIMQREKALRCYYKKKEAKKGDIQK